MKSNTFSAVCCIEPLESRIAPATLLNPRTVSYIDPDGDTVLVKTSKGTFDLAADFVFEPSGAGEQLRLIGLKDKREFAGTNVRVIASGPGDGRAHVGFIDASGIDLGAVVIDGDLGRIVAGDSLINTRGLSLLNVQSMGAFGVTTQAPPGSLSSLVVGNFGKWMVAGDVKNGAQINVGSLGSAVIGGSMIGNSTGFSGGIFAAANIGSVKILVDLLGAAGGFSGRIESFSGNIGSVFIGGQVLGIAADSGAIVAGRSIGSVKIGGDLTGGTGANSGLIQATDEGIRSIIIGGGIKGAAGANSGTIFAHGSIGSIVTGTKTDGSLLGGGTNGAGRIESSADIGKIVIGGDLRGGTGSETGEIIATRGRLGFLSIEGDFIGGNSNAASNGFTGYVLASDIGVIKISGNMQGGSQQGAGILIESGVIHSTHAIASITVAGTMTGGTGNPVVITALGAVRPSTRADIAIGKIHVGVSIFDTNILAGYDQTSAPKNIDSQIGSIKAGNDILRSNIAAGSTTGTDAFFGDANDAPIIVGSNQAGVVSRIGEIIVGGKVDGTVAGGDRFGFVARQIGLVRIGGAIVPLNPGAFNDLVPIQIAAATGDVFVREV